MCEFSAADNVKRILRMVIYSGKGAVEGLNFGAKKVYYDKQLRACELIHKRCWTSKVHASSCELSSRCYGNKNG